jgi:hypothetical protein
MAMLGSAFIFRTNSSALVFIVFGTLSNISSSIASFVSVSITAGGEGNTSIHKDGKHSEKPYEKQMFHKI